MTPNRMGAPLQEEGANDRWNPRISLRMPELHEDARPPMTPSTGEKERRIRTLVKPGLQMRTFGVLAFLVLVALTVQGMVLHASLSALTDELPNDGSILGGRTSSVLITGLLVGAVVLVPLALGFALMASNRVAGPLHRVESHLRAFLDGQSPRALTLRRNDELQELCALVNEVTLPRVEGRTVAHPDPSRALEQTPSILPPETSSVSTPADRSSRSN